MQELLIRKLHEYIRDNNPDLLLTLQEEDRVTEYLQEQVAALDDMILALIAENKPMAVIEPLCMDELTKPLRPSRFNYLKGVLEDEFPTSYERLRHQGLLTTELINLITACDDVFDEATFSEDNEDNRYLRYAIIGAVHDYLTNY